MHPAAAAVIISEIMFNPASSEKPPAKTEWVEIYNAGTNTADLTGWYLQDEDGHTGPIPKGTMLRPGKALVLIPGVQTVAHFRAAWGTGFAVIPLKHWSKGGLHGLSNNPSPTNEILTLRKPNKTLVDKVNFDDSAPWPTDRPDGPSIELAKDKLNAKANDDGHNWHRAQAGKDGAHHAKATKDYSAKDVGSPGYVKGPPLPPPRVAR